MTELGKDLDMIAATTPTFDEATELDSAADYQSVLRFDAPSEAVFNALTTTPGLTEWWAPVTGSGEAGGELRFDFGAGDPLIVRVDTADRPSTVTWTVLECNFMPDWVGTMPSCMLTPQGTNRCELRFRHRGLTPQLECFDTCRAGWDQYLPSLHKYVETGHGDPVRLGVPA